MAHINRWNLNHCQSVTYVTAAAAKQSFHDQGQGQEDEHLFISDTERTKNVSCQRVDFPVPMQPIAHVSFWCALPKIVQRLLVALQ